MGNNSRIGKGAETAWEPSAVADMADILLRRPATVEQDIMEAIELLSQHPHVGEKTVELRPVYRRYVCGDFQIVYRPPRGSPHWKEEIVIAAVRRLDDELDELL